jgi:hypothetical protein
MNAVADDYLLQRATDVRALLNYTRNTGVRPVNYTFDPPPGVPRNSGEVDARTVTIHDARAGGRDLFRGLQPTAPVVLVPAASGNTGNPVEDLRLRDRWPCPLDGTYGIRRSQFTS